MWARRPQWSNGTGFEQRGWFVGGELRATMGQGSLGAREYSLVIPPSSALASAADYKARRGLREGSNQGRS